jgi:hypothetical protein
VDVVAAALGFGGPGFRGLMPHQRQIIATGTEVGENGLPVYRQVVIEEPRQQGKSVGTLSLMVARCRETPGTMSAPLRRPPGCPRMPAAGGNSRRTCRRWVRPTATR